MPPERNLALFTAFHANLDFSAIPSVDLSLVVERCYWPLLELAASGLPLGVEMPVRTLEILSELDPEWIKTLRSEVERGRVEVLGSGLAQVVAPLVPLEVNRTNLGRGAERYAELLGDVPETWFVNEQTFSRGLVDLYLEAGARRLVMEWNNAASVQPSLRSERTRPARLRGENGSLGLLWNDSIVFQRVQQAAHGVREPADAVALVAEIAARWGGGCLCAYGGDLEIFDYRPGQPPSRRDTGCEMGGLQKLLAELAIHFDLVLPRDAAARCPQGSVVDLASASDPMPCKKQPRYNPTRWAVSGRDGLGMNTRCHALHRLHRVARALGSPPDPNAERALVELWRSDLRTRATEEKVEAFSECMGAQQERARAALDAAVPALPEGADLLLLNPWEQPWAAAPVEVELRFPRGRLRGAGLEVAGATAAHLVAWQIESAEHYRDGSLRQATFVLDLSAEPGGRLALRVVPRAHAFETASAASTHRVVTETVEASFNETRGGALRALSFPRLGARPVAGSIDHGHFLDMAHSPDFYSGHVVAYGEDGQKVTDLQPVAEARIVADGPVRVALQLRVETAFGEWVKHWRLYRRTPRLDLRHDLRFPALRLASLRLGTLTLLPEAWGRETFHYATVQGGAAAERFPLRRDETIDQGRAISPAVSSTSCLGATEGWSSLADRDHGLMAVTNRALGAAVPMLTARDVDDSFFARLEHSAAERDENRATFFRGVRSFAFAWLGFGAEPDGARAVAGQIERGLVLRNAGGTGLARAL